MNNASLVLNQKCLKFYQKTQDEWKCFMAEYALEFIKTPLFVVQSMLDSWQALNILGFSKEDNFAKVTWEKMPTSVTKVQIDHINEFRTTMLKSSLGDYTKKSKKGGDYCINNSNDTVLPTSQNFNSTTKGAWLSLCWGHTFLNTNMHWNGLTADSVTLVKAFNSWYSGEDAKHVHIDGDWGSNDCHADIKVSKHDKKHKHKKGAH